MRFPRFASCLVLLTCLTTVRANITFVFDYSYDDSGFFTGENSYRQSYMEAVGDYVSSLISGTSLSAISPVGNAGYSATISDPSIDGGIISFDNLSVAADTIIVFVGGISDLGSNVLAHGGPAIGSVVDESDTNLIANLLYRGTAGSRMTAVGSISFGTSWNWYFDNDYTTVESFEAEYDFFSTAAHELFHVLGFGVYEAWTDQVSDGVYLGTESVATYGEAVPVEPEIEAHWAQDTWSTVYAGDDAQEALMCPATSTNVRDYATDLDVAALADLGYIITAVPEPANTALILTGLASLGLALKRRRAG